MKLLKMRNKIIVAIFIVMSLLICSFLFIDGNFQQTTVTESKADYLSATSSSAPIDTSIFTFVPINDNECSVRLSDRTVTKAIVPSTAVINGVEYTVTAVAANGFANSSNLEKVWLPDTIKDIGASAFINCKLLKPIALSAVETIGTNAFSMTKFDYIILPETLTSVDSTILRNCTTSVYIRASQDKINASNWHASWNDYNSGDIVEYESKFTPPIQYRYEEFFVEPQISPLSLSANEASDKIEGYVVDDYQPFVNESKTDIYIPAEHKGLPVIAISDSAFWYNDMKTITIGYSDTPIRVGSLAFYCSESTNITINRDIYFESNYGAPSESVFSSCMASTIILPNSLTELGNNAFMDCANLKDIHFVQPKYMSQSDEQSIAQTLISTCNVNLPDTVTKLGSEVFSGIKNIQTLNIPKSITIVGKSVFVGWSAPQIINIDYDSKEDLGTGWNPLWNSGCDLSIIEYAKPQIFDITYKLNGGTHNGNPSTYSPKDKVVLKDAERNGYIFNGWFNNTGNKLSEIVVGTVGNIELEAKWTPIKYSIQYNSNKPSNASGAIVGATITSEHIYDIEKALNPNGYSLKGWSFIGWKDSNGKQYIDCASVLNLTNQENDTITLYAQWLPNSYTITYLVNRPATASAAVNGSMVNSPHTYDTESALRSNTYSLEGWKFVGWNDAEGNFYADGQKVKTASEGGTIAFLAQWEENDYTIAYDKNLPYNASNPVLGVMTADNVKYETTQMLKTNSYSLKGWFFEGWNTDKNGNGTQYKDNENVNHLTAVDNKVITLYAQWIPKRYTIEYLPNGGSGVIYQSFHTYDTPQRLLDSRFTMTGYHVFSWKDNTGNSYNEGETVKNLTDINGKVIQLTAQWTANTYYINYNANGGTGNMPRSEQDYDAPLELSKNEFVREGYVFVGWSESPNGPALSFWRPDLTTPIVHNFVESGSVTLYALWDEFSYTVVFTSSYPGYSYPLFPEKQITAKWNQTISNTVDDRISKPGESGMFQKVIVFSHWTVKPDNADSWNVYGTTISGSNFTKTHGIRVTITAHYIDPPDDGGCVAEGTLITLADGSQKPVEALTGNEQLLVWNLKTGKFDTAPILFIDSDPMKKYEVINLTFTDGTTVKVISEHGFWDFDLNQYVFLRNDAAKYIGHWFNKQTTGIDGTMSWIKVQLTSVDVTTEVTTSWSPVTYEHLCYYVNGMLSMPGATTGLINIFDVDPETMKIDEAAYEADIEKYGLFTYEEFTAIYQVPEFIFDAFGGQYLKVAFGKGLLTEDMLTGLIARYAKFFNVQ